MIVNATAIIEAYLHSLSVGTWGNSNSIRGVCVGDFRYTNSIGYTRAPSNGRFIAFAVVVYNRGFSGISANPNDVTIVIEDGRSYAYSSESYINWARPMEHTVIAPGDSAQGGIVFLVPNDVIPERIIYRGGLFKSNNHH